MPADKETQSDYGLKYDLHMAGAKNKSTDPRLLTLVQVLRHLTASGDPGRVSGPFPRASRMSAWPWSVLLTDGASCGEVVLCSVKN